MSEGHASCDLTRVAGHAGLLQIFVHLPNARLVGGSVRDLLLGESPADLDLATPEPPEHVQALLEEAAIKVVPTGLAHGTVTAVIDRVPYEITTLRRDDTTDGRHASVSWTTDWREDASRRDFTINAMSCDRDGRVWDYFAGLADLEAGRVRFVGDAATRIVEDALRILRFFRFSARFARALDHEALRAITAKAALVDALSRERVASEMLRLLAGPSCVAMLRAMAECGVLQRLLVVEAAGLDRLEQAIILGLPEDGVLRLGLLAQAPAIVGREWRLSNQHVARLAALSGPERPDPHWDDDALRRALSLATAEALKDRSWDDQVRAPKSGDWGELRARIMAMPVPVFPLTGRDALSAGLTPGPAMGQALRTVQEWWRAGGCRAGREACLARLLIDD